MLDLQIIKHSDYFTFSRIQNTQVPEAVVRVGHDTA